MATGECIEVDGPSEVNHTSRTSDTTGLAIETLIHQLSDLISAVGSYRPQVSDGIGWVSLDTALCGLHSAVVALEEFGAHRAEVPARSAVPGSNRTIGV
jgi:hypothetical protein